MLSKKVVFLVTHILNMALIGFKINTFKQARFEQILSSFAGNTNKQVAESSPAYQEYRDMKKTLYPFWQSSFHYNEWKDDQKDKIKINRQKLKERTIITTSTKYKFEEESKIEQFIQENLPFSKCHS